MFVDELLIDCPDDVEVDLDRLEVQQRHTEFVRGGDGDCAGVCEFCPHQVRNQRQPFRLRRFGRIQELLLGNNAVLNQPPGQAGEVGL